jgi:hypothetical protein
MREEAANAANQGARIEVGKHVKEMERNLTNSVSQSVESKLTLARQDIDAAIASAQLYQVAAELEDEDSFSSAEKDNANGLLGVAGKSIRVRASRAFGIALERLLDSYVPADLAQDVDQIETDYRDICVKSKGITITLASYYSLRCIGELTHPPEVEERFKRYVQALRSHQQDESGTALAFDLLHAFSLANTQTNSLQAKLWAEAKFLKSQERERMWGVFEQFEMYEDSPVDGKTQRAGDLYRQFATAYAKELKEVQAAKSSVQNRSRLQQQLQQLLNQRPAGEP